MIHHSFQFLGVIALLGALCSLGYYSLCLWGAATFLRKKRAGHPGVQIEVTPPISVLKPLKGADPEMYENLRSHCLQDYPDYEIIFGISETNDPAALLVERLQTEFPQRAIRLMLCPKRLGANMKVSNLAQMISEARHQHLVVNDSDIRVEAGYLRMLAAALEDCDVGMVTCLYRGIPSATLGSRLESAGISTDFCGGVLAARQIEGGIRFGLGSTLAFRRSDLEQIGGFESIADYLADDYELGSRMAAQGRKIELSEMVVETYLPPYSIADFMRHQLRWARSVRDSRPWGYVGLVLTFGLLWGMLEVVCAHGAPAAWGLLGALAVSRLAVAYVVGRLVLEDRGVLPHLYLIPLRDIIAFLVWLASFTGHTVAWRGDLFTLKNGKLARTSP